MRDDALPKRNLRDVCRWCSDGVCSAQVDEVWMDRIQSVAVRRSDRNTIGASFITALKAKGERAMAVISANLATTQAWTSVEREEPVALRRIVGESAAVQSLRALIAAVAGNHSTIMLTGESGTGKELIARTIHSLSDRADRPFLAVQCASFSHGPLGQDAQADSGTNTSSGSDGFFDIVAAAAGGTIYFDEVADMSLSLQAKLLRHFEVGDARDSDPSDREGSVRIIAASKHGVPRIGPGALQPKLYYRLCVAELQIPPLRDRIDDLPLLADFFNAKHAQSYGQTALVISSDVIGAMRGYAWPGNVQELANPI